MSKNTADIIANILENFDPETLARELMAAGEEWADADAAASLLEETKKSLHAKLCLEYVAEGVPSGKPNVPAKPMSQAQAESKALADDRYQLHLKRMVEARKESNAKRVRYDTGKLKVELLRSLQATIRQELHMNRSGF